MIAFVWIVEINYIFVDTDLNLMEGHVSKRCTFWIAFSGLVWFVVGTFLLVFGVKLIVYASLEQGERAFLLGKLFHVVKSKERAALLLLVSGLLLGFMKGRFVLSKTVARVVKRIASLPEPIKASQVYPVGYIALIGCMILLGISMRWLGIPLDVRGGIDVAVGSALMNGAMLYFRCLFKRSVSR
jgi:hypothetical protein